MFAFAVTLLAAPPLRGQVIEARSAHVWRGLETPDAPLFGQIGRIPPPVLSLVVPGIGQAVQGQRRGWAYTALEVVGWVVYVDRRRSAGRYRARYRDLAWETARLHSTERIEGDFDYYERLLRWERSGRFDRDADAAGVQPEGDPSSFNGSIWDRAQRIYGVVSEGPGAPAYEAALEYYGERAYDDGFLWDWTDQAEARDRYGALIGTSDARFQQATVALGLLFANHLISAADAFVSVRGLSLELAPAPEATEIRVHWEWTP